MSKVKGQTRKVFSLQHILVSFLKFPFLHSIKGNNGVSEKLNPFSTLTVPSFTDGLELKKTGQVFDTCPALLLIVRGALAFSAPIQAL